MVDAFLVLSCVAFFRLFPYTPRLTTLQRDKGVRGCMYAWLQQVINEEQLGPAQVHAQADKAQSITMKP